MTSESKAKEMFFSYACNHYFMHRDGTDKIYRKYAISKKQENKWKDEYIEHFINELNGNNLDALNALANCHADRAIPAIIKFSIQGESFEKLWFAITLFSMSNNKHQSVHQQAKKQGIEICEFLINNPITISSQCKRQINKGALQALKADNHEDYIINYANSLLKQHKG